MEFLSRIADKTGVLGSIVSAMGCSLCFPAMASLGAALGLGFLSQWEAAFVAYLIPLFAFIALAANALGWFSHRQWQRAALGMTGPVLVLIGRYTFIGGILYAGLGLMLIMAIFDLVVPARRCATTVVNVDAKPSA
ncbi:MAG: organomercurial transporter MerC [Rhizobiaceae bacterium]|nr:MAG: organomercurial transporter MerC [Rhizobiaceae bacterium]